MGVEIRPARLDGSEAIVGVLKGWLSALHAMTADAAPVEIVEADLELADHQQALASPAVARG
jgi:hypothetical protein